MHSPTNIKVCLLGTYASAFSHQLQWGIPQEHCVSLYDTSPKYIKGIL